MTQSQFQIVKEVLEHHGYIVSVYQDFISIVSEYHEAFKLQYDQNKDRICIILIAGFFLIDQIEREFAEVKEVMLDLQLNGVPVAM